MQANLAPRLSEGDRRSKRCSKGPPREDPPHWPHRQAETGQPPAFGELTQFGATRMCEYMQVLEEKIAHLIRVTEDLSEVVARQETEIAMLTRRVQMLMEREAEREAGTAGQVFLGDERPPHW